MSALDCVRGHEFTPANTYKNNDGRGCRECRRLRPLRPTFNRETPAEVSPCAL